MEERPGANLRAHAPSLYHAWLDYQMVTTAHTTRLRIGSEMDLFVYCRKCTLLAIVASLQQHGSNSTF